MHLSMGPQTHVRETGPFVRVSIGMTKQTFGRLLPLHTGHSKHFKVPFLVRRMAHCHAGPITSGEKTARIFPTFLLEKNEDENTLIRISHLGKSKILTWHKG